MSLKFARKNELPNATILFFQLKNAVLVGQLIDCLLAIIFPGVFGSQIQCDQIGLLLKSLGHIFSLAQILGNLLCYFKDISLKTCKTVLASFLDNFGEKLATFNCSVWSQCSQ